MDQFVEYLISPYKSYETWQIVTEAIAAFFGILSVYYSSKRNILVYPTGIISTFLYIFLLFNWGLYGETLVNIYYTIMSIYGWILWRWNLTKDEQTVEILYMNKKEYLYAFLLFIFSFGLILLIYFYRPFIQNGFDITFIQHKIPDYTLVDYLDATVTALFLVGMWLMARRKIENWILWILGDFMAIYLYFYKGFGITGLQYVIFTILAIRAYFLWRKSYNKIKI